MQNNLRLWDMASGKELWRVSDPSLFTYALGFSPDGRMLASGGKLNTIQLWETATGTEIRRCEGHHSGIACFCFSPDSRRLISGSGDSTALVWDLTGRIKEGRLQGRLLSPKEVQARWAELANPNASRGHQALWDLVAAPGQSIPFLKQKLRPARAVDPKRVARLIADLDSKRYSVRQKATIELEKLGDLAEPALRARLTGNLPLESQQRLDRLLQKLEGLSTERLRTLRALAVLEQVGRAPAREVLEALAKGPAEARLTRDAKAVLKRFRGWRAVKE
jgi:hypothetical protein